MGRGDRSRETIEQRVQSFLDKVVTDEDGHKKIKWKSLRLLASMDAECCIKAYDTAFEYLRKQEIITWDPHGDYGLFAAYSIPMNPMGIGGRIFYTRKREHMEECVDALYDDKAGIYIRKVGEPLPTSAKQQ